VETTIVDEEPGIVPNNQLEENMDAYLDEGVRNDIRIIK
jgi:hypothetical protein